MNKSQLFASASAMRLATMIAGSAMLVSGIAADAAPKKNQSYPAVNVSSGAPRTQRPSTDLNLSVGRGQLINLSAPISDVFVANEDVADVQVRSATHRVCSRRPVPVQSFIRRMSGQVRTPTPSTQC